jgi:signal transduction histidine kinase
VTGDLVDPAHVLTALPDGVVVADADRRVSYVNPRAARLLGTSEQELLGRPVAEALPFIEPGGNRWWECINPWDGLPTRTGHRERMLLLPGRGHVLVTMSFVRGGRLAPVERVIVVLRDTEARRRSEAGTAELLSIVAHELRSPLSSIRGFSGTLRRQYDRFTDAQRRLMIDTIATDSQRLSRLLNELLDVSRIDASRLTVRPSPLDLRAAITAHIDGLVAAGHDPSRFAWAEARQPRLEVWADRDRLDQILANLLENALRHGAGTVTVATSAAPGAAPTIEEAGGDGTPMVAVTVTDEGDGIDPELYPLIFEKFWHGQARGSTGVGLYLVKGLVEAHGGRVSVDRARAGGAQFRITLPVSAPADLR